MTALHERITRRVRAAVATGTVGMTSAEYAVGTVAACGFGGLLYKVLTSDSVLSLLTQVIGKAWHRL